MESNKSLLLSNPNITLKKIGQQFSSIDKRKNFGNLTILPNDNAYLLDWKKISWYIAPGDFRQKVKIKKDRNNYYMFLGANRCNSNPGSVSIGKEEKGTYFLIREQFSDAWIKNPQISQRNLFILGEEQIFSDEELFSFDFNDLSSLSKEEKEYLDKILEAIEVFGEYFSLQEMNISQTKGSHAMQKTLQGKRKE